MGNLPSDEPCLERSCRGDSYRVTHPTDLSWNLYFVPCDELRTAPARLDVPQYAPLDRNGASDQI